MFDYQVSDINLEESVPEDVNIDLGSDGSLDTEISSLRESQIDGAHKLAGMIAGRFI